MREYGKQEPGTARLTVFLKGVARRIPGLLRLSTWARARARRRSSLAYYKRLAEGLLGEQATFFNFGYCTLDGEVLNSAIQPETFHLQLYDQLLSRTQVAGKSVLEVGSGHGGGCRHLADHYNAGSVVGLDHAPSNIECARRHSDDAIRYELGDACAMPFEDRAFDVVVCVEATHDFPSVAAFLKESHRVLRPGGWLLVTDFRWDGGEEDLRGQVLQSPLQLEDWWEIGRNVLEAIRRDNQRRSAWIREVTPDEATFQWLANIAMLVGSERYERFENGDMKYVSFLCRKAR